MGDFFQMLIIDRISDGIAVIEDDESCFEVSAEMLSADVKEGDAVVLCGDIYVKDENATNERRKKIIEMQNDLWE